VGAELDQKRRLGAFSARRAQWARRIGSTGILLSGLITLLSALTPTLRLRLGRVEDVLPLSVHQTVFAVTAMLGVVLVQLAHGLKRGQRRAWIAAVTVLVATVVAHVAKGLDLGESAVSGVLVVYLVASRRHFRAPSDPAPLRRSALALVGSSGGALATAIVICATRRHGRLAWGRAVSAVLERLVGNSSIKIGGRLDRFLTPAIGGVAVITVLGLGWLLLRPALRRTGGEPTLAAAREIVKAFGDDTLSYFALRTDKRR
jgi:lysyl-tRNA synthetase, class II